MIRQLAMGVSALLASTGAALAETEVIAGDLGFDRQVLRGAELYDATDATVLVEQGRNNTGYNVRSSPERAMFLGGRTLGQGANRTMTWRPLYDRGNGACIRFENSPRFTVRRHFGEFCWDPIKVASGSNNWAVEESWIRHARDDAIEADHHGAHDGVVRRSLLEGVHTFLSVKPGKGQPIEGRARVEFHDNVMSLGCGLDDGLPCEDRDKRLKYGWARPRGSGQAIKLAGCGEAVDILFRNNVVAIGAELVDGEWVELGINTSGSNLRFFQCAQVDPASTGNTFYWLGGCDFRGLEMTTLHGACVPRKFELDPDVWTAASNDRDAWLAEVARWRTEIWEGAPLSDPELEPEPEPDTEPEPEPEPDHEPDMGSDSEPTDEIVVAVDIRPEQCPNRVRTNKDRNFPVVVVGTDNFDVRTIDPESVRLAGVPPKHHRTRVRDRAGPYEPMVGRTDANDCGRDGPDGLDDLLLRFSSETVGKAIGPVPNGTIVVVPLTGELEDGTPIRGEDVMVVLN
jgi:hypothetical protein